MKLMLLVSIILQKCLIVLSEICAKQPTIYIDHLSAQVDFIDLSVGDTLKLLCRGEWNRSDPKRQLDWIVPAYHPLYESTLPEYINITETIIDEKFIESNFVLNGIEVNDVGYYVCIYRSYLVSLDDSLLNSKNSLYVYVTDLENLFVKSMPITMGISGRPAEIECRASSSKGKMSLLRFDSENKTYEKVFFQLTDQWNIFSNGQNSWQNHSDNIARYNPRRGFFVPNISTDRFICQKNPVFKVDEVETISLRKGKELVRVNLTVFDVKQNLHGTVVECLINDVSFAQKSSQHSFKIYEKAVITIKPRYHWQTTQVSRCNSLWKFELEIDAIPNDINLINLTWSLQNSENQTRIIHYGDSRISLAHKYLRNNHNNDSEAILVASIKIQHLLPKDSGLYRLEAILMNGLALANQSIELKVLECNLSDLVENFILYLLLIAFVVFLMLLFIFLLTHRIRTEKIEKRELEMISLSLLSNARAAMIDPNIPIHEQIDLLKYDHRLEVSLENIDFGSLLGQGAFGKVYKALVFGLETCSKSYSYLVDCDARNDCATIAAVKILKNHDLNQLKALTTELKMMNYIGFHVNVVNLLGACTANLIKGELYVIIEYCCYGNLQQFLKNNRHKYIESSDESKVIEQSQLEKENFKNVLNQLLTKRNNETKQNNRIKEWDNQLTQNDLLVFAFQISEGMLYLAERKVVHRDLAARNVLLCRNKIVKICDFGLARDSEEEDYWSNQIKSSDQQQVLPVKWMAIESLRDRIYSSKSDMWSFGVVLWEMFSLGMMPYPGIEIDGSFYQKLLDGYRMSRPKHSPESIYEMMLKCWSHLATDRPDFRYTSSFFKNLLSEPFLKKYEYISQLYEQKNAEFENDENLLYKDLSFFNKSSLFVSTPPTSSDYLLMLNQISKTGEMNENGGGASVSEIDTNYVQMEFANFNVNQ